MRNIFALMVAGLLSSTASNAAVPVVGLQPVDQNLIACDTDDQVREIHNARLAHGVPAGVEVFRHYNSVESIFGGEPACLLGNFANSTVSEVQELPVLSRDEEEGKHAFLVKLVAQRGTFSFYVLWHHTDGEAIQPSSMPPSGIDERGMRFIHYQVPWR